MKPVFKKLSNGIPVILAPIKGTESMTLMVFVKVGSRYEPQKINGASHFIEHLMFKGTKRRPNTLLLTKTLDRYGAEYNAATGKDFTEYYIKIDAAQTSLAVDLLHDMLFHSLYDPKEIERERGVIVEEINMYEDNPRMHIEDLLESALFPASTLGRSIAGPREVIRGISRDDLIAYRDAYYIPSRLTITVAGAVTEDILPHLEKTFGRVREPAHKLDQMFTPFVAPVRLAEPIAFQNKQTEQVQLGIAFHGFAVDDARTPAAILLSTILGGSMSSRLFIQVRERRGLCYSIYSSHASMEDTGMFTVMAGLEKTRVDQAVKIIWRELQATARKGVTTDELRHAKDHIRGKLMLAWEDSSTRADWYGKGWLFRHKLITPEERLQQLERVRMSDVRAAAQTLFRTPSMAAALIGPFGDKQKVRNLFPFHKV